MNDEQNTTGAPANGAPANGFASRTPTSRVSPFPTTKVATKPGAAAQGFLGSAQPFRTPVTSQPAYPLSIASNIPFDRDATRPLGAPFSATTPALSQALIRNLPLNTTEESLRLMMTFSKELVDVEVLPVEQSEDRGFRSAIVKFKTPAGAMEAKNILDGKTNISNDAELIVELRSPSPSSLGKRYSGDAAIPSGPSAVAPTTTPVASSGRQTSRFNGTFQSRGFSKSDLSAPDYQTIFSPQSPIGSHLSEMPARVTGKALIDATEDEETRELLNDPISFAEGGGLQRRQTAPVTLQAPQVPLQQRMAALSLNTAQTAMPNMMSHYGRQSMGSLAGLAGPVSSPTVMAQAAYNPQPAYRHNFPPANPADQNPPCNTLYVGNLPADTSEEELKSMFSRQRGYRRLCFRTKANGPMCFVEFEDVTCATKALHELYGQMLHNSIKGGIRLSFSKNPLGVRSGQTPGQNNGGPLGPMTGMHTGINGFTTANGPPPGLSAPPGLGMARPQYSAMAAPYNTATFGTNPNNLWGPAYNGHATMMAGGSSAVPPHMMGR